MPPTAANSPGVMPCQIRAMVPTDIAAAHELWTEAEGVEVAEGDAPEQLARYLARNPGLSSVAAGNGGQQFWRREGWEEISVAKPMGLDL